MKSSRLPYYALAVTLAFLVAGALVSVSHRDEGRLVWLVGIVIAGAPLVFHTLRDALRGHFATDVVASLSIIGAVAFNQPLAGLVIVLMQTGGEALEQYAEGKASAALSRLEQAAPRIAHVVRNGAIDDVPVGDVHVGDVLLVRPGDILPCDGEVLDGESDVNAASLTGEALPVRATPGVRVMSGSVNGMGSLRYRATASAQESQYARIVELVRAAQESKAPLQRVADRYAVWFTPITIAACILAVALTGDKLRALAILVVATPCPLILAAPVAFIGGINSAARRSIIVRTGAALEQLAAVDTVVFDKTGTLTVGQPRLADVRVAPGFSRDDVLRCAASVEEHSSHLVARVLVDAVKREGLEPFESTSLQEAPGQGISGTVNGKEVWVGGRTFVLSHVQNAEAVAASLEQGDPTLRAYVAIGDQLAAVLDFADELRPDLAQVLDRLPSVGVTRVVLLSGDRTSIAQEVAARVGIREAHGDLLPEDKARFIEDLRRQGRVVMMVGDGINDAPALSTADVGTALASYNAGIAAEAADVVVMVDVLERVVDAIVIGERSMRIARESIWVGLGLSAIGMVFAGLGKLQPLTGALLQEAIDVAVILNALRAARTPGR